MMKNKWRMPPPATMFLLLTMAVVFLSWICDIYGLKVTLPQTGEDIRVQSLLSPEGIRWWLRNAIKNFTGFAPLGMVKLLCLDWEWHNIPVLLMHVSAWGWETDRKRGRSSCG